MRRGSLRGQGRRGRVWLLGTLAVVALALVHSGGGAGFAASCTIGGSISISPGISFAPDTPAATIMGTCFLSGNSIASVTFGSNTATLGTVTDTSIPLTVPAGSGTVAVTVTQNVSGAGTAPATTSYTYAPLPSATDVTPALVFNDAATSAAVNGSGLAPSTSSATVSVNSGTAITPSSTSNTAINFSVPAASSTTGNVPVSATVTLTGDARTITVPNGLTYVAPPAVTSIVPTRGTAKGGTSVTITGSGLKPPTGATTEVDFGTYAAASFTQDSDTQITAFTPTVPDTTNTVHVTVKVTLPNGAGSRTSPTSANDEFTFVPAPSVTSVTNSTAPADTPTDVTVNGNYFLDGAVVLFGPSDSSPFTNDLTASAFDVTSTTAILATTPVSPPGATNVIVVNPDGQYGVLKSSDASHFSFTGTTPTLASTAPICVTGSSPCSTSGPSLGGTQVTISGTGFQSGASVLFRTDSSDPAPARATVNSVSATSISVTTAAHTAGVVDVVVTNPDGGSVKATGGFTYTASPAPTLASSNPICVTNVSPCTASGPSTGGTSVTISGTGFGSGASVTFGGTKALVAAVLNSTTLTATTPAHAASTTAVDVVVTNPDGQTATAMGAFTYTQGTAPTIAASNPICVSNSSPCSTSGSSAGGTQVTITGTGFLNGLTVTFDTTMAPATTAAGTPATTVSADGKTITTITPAHTAATVPVTVTNPDGQAATASSAFTFADLATLKLTSVTPNTGNTLGGESVMLSGAGFAPGARVQFGGVAGPATSTTVSSDGKSITTITPAGVYGLVNVAVTNPNFDSTKSCASQPGACVSLPYAFTFANAPAPAITSISLSAPAVQGITLTITGTGFACNNPAKLSDNTTDPYAYCGGTSSSSNANAVNNASVTVGGKTLLPLPPPSGSTVSPSLVQTPMQIQGILPSLPAGPQDIVVMNPDHQGVILTGACPGTTTAFCTPDTSAPTTTATATSNSTSYSLTSTKWTNADVAVSLSATDPDGASDVNQITYSSTGGQTIAKTNVTGASASVTIASDGKTVLSYYATDNAGNVETAHTANIWVDKTASTLTVAATIPNGSLTQPYTPGTVTNQNVTVSFTCSDATSGVGTLTFISTGTTTHSGTNPLNVTVTSVGTDQSVTGTCTDNAGNSTSTTFDQIDINRTAPVITASATSGGQTYTAGTWTDQPVTVTFSCTPVPGGAQIVSITQPIQITTEQMNDTVSGTCIDASSPPLSASTTFGTSIAGIDIDLTPPKIAVASATIPFGNGTQPYTAGTWTNQNVTVTFSCADQGTYPSGVTGGQAFLTAPITISAEGTTSSVTGSCTDAAGNLTNPPSLFGPILIDKTPPTCAVGVNPNPIGPANGKLVSVVATVNVGDQSTLSGPNGFKLVSINENNTGTFKSTDVTGFTLGAASTSGQLRATKGNTYLFTYQVFDVGGNMSTCSPVKVTVS